MGRRWPWGPVTAPCGGKTKSPPDCPAGFAVSALRLAPLFATRCTQSQCAQREERERARFRTRPRTAERDVIVAGLVGGASEIDRHRGTREGDTDGGEIAESAARIAGAVVGKLRHQIDRAQQDS